MVPVRGQIGRAGLGRARQGVSTVADVRLVPGAPWRNFQGPLIHNSKNLETL